MTTPTSEGLTSEAVVARARALGFAVAGVAPAHVAPAAVARLRAWLAAGRHGTMDWMAGTMPLRASPAGLWPPVRSIVMVGLAYTPPDDPLRHLGRGELATLSVYARGQDYHGILKSKLKALGRWLESQAGGQARAFVDSAPVLERPLAEAAGLGWQGKHSNLIHRAHGNWLFLGALYTDLALAPLAEAGAVGACGSCRRCIDACPTGAIVAEGLVDARLCISYLTVEHKGAVPRALRPLLGNRVHGCDDCLAVCPWNRFAHVPADARLLPRAGLDAPRLADLLTLDEPGFAELFAGSPVRRSGRERFVRNCLYAAGNSGQPALTGPVAALLADGSALVRGAAVWALGRLDAGRLRGLAAAHLPEQDPDVAEEWAQALADA